MGTLADTYGVPDDAMSDYDLQEPMVPGEEYAGIGNALVKDYRQYGRDLATLMRLAPHTLDPATRLVLDNARRLELSPVDRLAYEETMNFFKAQGAHPTPSQWKEKFAENLQEVYDQRPHMKGSNGSWQAVREMDAWNTRGKGDLRNPDLTNGNDVLPEIYHMTASPMGPPGDEELNAPFLHHGNIGHGSGFYGTTSKYLRDIYQFDRQSAEALRSAVSKPQVYQTTLPKGSVRVGADGQGARITDYFDWNRSFNQQPSSTKEKLYQLSDGKLAEKEYADQPVGPLLLPVESEIGHQTMLNELGDAGIAGNYHPDIIQPHMMPSKYYPAYTTSVGSSSPRGAVVSGAETGYPDYEVTKGMHSKLFLSPEYLEDKGFPWLH